MAEEEPDLQTETPEEGPDLQTETPKEGPDLQTETPEEGPDLELEGAQRIQETREDLRERDAELRDAELKRVHRSSHEFPDSLFELLCSLQEGRRLNDQRCSFTELQPTARRRCHSEPNTGKPPPRVVFSSMSSLQREEFFDLVATAQNRRLNDQRASLRAPAPHRLRGLSLRGLSLRRTVGAPAPHSLRGLSLRRTVGAPAPPPAPALAPAPKDELYSMILHTQAQGRLEDQRSRAPGPMDDEVFFSLLLRVQGGRMDEQRTELPCL